MNFAAFPNTRASVSLTPAPGTEQSALRPGSTQGAASPLGGEIYLFLPFAYYYGARCYSPLA
jgi:hypothetical protein